MIKRTASALALLVVLGATASACGTNGSVDSGAAPKGTNASVKPETKSKSPKPSPSGPQVAQFGQTFKYSDGLAIRVGKPLPYTISDSGFGQGKGTPVVFTITVVNGTKKIYDASLVSSTVQSGTTEAQEIYDSAHGLNGSPSTKLLPGREATWREGFKVKNPSDLVYDLTPDFDHNDEIWTNSQ